MTRIFDVVQLNHYASSCTIYSVTIPLQTPSITPLKCKKIIKYIIKNLKICAFLMYRFGICVYLKCNVSDY